MSAARELDTALDAAMRAGEAGLAAADRLCRACVDLLEVDGAAISLMVEGSSRGTFGSSDPLSRHLDELQFTFGEGPCFDAARDRQPVFVPDLANPAEQRWPAFIPAGLAAGVAAMFALPVDADAATIGVLDLIRHRKGPLRGVTLAGGFAAARLATEPLLHLMTSALDWGATSEAAAGSEDLASIERVEVYQATGMVLAALDITADEALAMIRAHAFAIDSTAAAVAWDVIERRSPLTERTGPIEKWRRDAQ